MPEISQIRNSGDSFRNFAKVVVDKAITLKQKVKTAPTQSSPTPPIRKSTSDGSLTGKVVPDASPPPMPPVIEIPEPPVEVPERPIVVLQDSDELPDGWNGVLAILEEDPISEEAAEVSNDTSPESSRDSNSKAPSTDEAPSTKSLNPEKDSSSTPKESATEILPVRKKPITMAEKLKRREELRNKLLGLVPSLPTSDVSEPMDSPPTPLAPSSDSSDLFKPNAPVRRPKSRAGVSKTIKQPEKSKSRSSKDDELVASLFADERKQEKKVTLQKPKELVTPDLPDGLTAEALLNVISNNSLSIKLCLDKALRKGEKPKGRLDIRILINSNGSVDNVKVKAPQIKGTTMRKCVRKRIKLWRFPPFSGESVPVEFPYLLSSSY